MEAQRVELGFGERWSTYFQERFPPLQYAAALGLYAFATLAYSARVAGMSDYPGAHASVVAFVVAILTFLQLRIHDEFKDYEDDLRYRPERPVPRGLVTLHSLAQLGWLAAAVQLLASATLGARPIVLLLAILAYSWLMRAEFFVRAWLKSHALAYLLSHMLIVPLLTIYIASCAADVAVGQLGWYLLFSYGGFAVFEIGRKIWAPAEERAGVETYTSLWGRGRAVTAWLGALYGSSAAAVLAVRTMDVVLPVAITAAAVALPATATGIWFVQRIAPVRGAWFRALSACWFLGIHLVVGVAIVRAL